jgi:hypothetical protein
LPVEIEQLRLIDRFGSLAVLGRQPTHREMTRMLLAETVAYGCRAFYRAGENSAAWAAENPEAHRAYVWALRERESLER